MSKKSHAQQLKKFETFLAGESQDFDVVALDPQLFATAGQRIADGFTIESAGGACPFQATGEICARAVDGAPVPMQWYYRSRHGWARLSVGISQDSEPLFSASLAEIAEFDYSHWLSNLTTLIQELKPQPYTYSFPAFAIDENYQVHDRVRELGLGVRDVVALHHGGDQRVADLPIHRLVTTIGGLGHNADEALVDARTFRPTAFLTNNGISEDRQRAYHAALVATMDPSPFNPWLNRVDLDTRPRPDVQLADPPFVVAG